MKRFAVKHPILFEAILIIVSFILVIIASIPLQALYFSNEVTTSLARILVGGFLFIVFLYCFKLKKQFSSFPIVLPGLLFVLWNVANCFMTGGSVNMPDMFMFIEAAAPAIFEEIIFREIFIYHLKENGRKDLEVVLIAAVVFSLIHLTNVVGGNLIQTLVQTGYSLVVGLFFSAVYVKSDDLFSLIILHGLIDFSSRIFVGASSTPFYVLFLFAILLIIETLYSLWLTRKK